MKWYQDREGSTSSMRIMAMMSTVTGCAAVIASIVGLFMRIPEAATIGTIGAGMAGLGEVSKAWQAKGGS